MRLFGQRKYTQLRNEVILAGYKVVPVRMTPPKGPFITRYRAYSPSGMRLMFWGNAYLDDEAKTYAACVRHMTGSKSSSGSVWEEPHMADIERYVHDDRLG